MWLVPPRPSPQSARPHDHHRCPSTALPSPAGRASLFECRVPRAACRVPNCNVTFSTCNPTQKQKEATMFPNRDYETVHSEIVSILETSRQQAARAVNATMTTAYWRIGRSIVECEQRGKQRAEYGDALVSRLATDLGVRFGRGFSQRNLRLMRKFYLQWSAKAIRQTVSANSDLGGMPSFPLPWSAYVQLMSVSNDHARLFYEAEALRCGWSVRQLDRQINSQYYERSALSRDIQGMLSTGTVTSQNEVMKDHSLKGPFISATAMSTSCGS